MLALLLSLLFFATLEALARRQLNFGFPGTPPNDETVTKLLSLPIHSCFLPGVFDKALLRISAALTKANVML